MKKCRILFAVVFVLLSTMANAGIQTIDEFVSPEYMCVSDNNTVYVGLSTYAGIVAFDVFHEKPVNIIAMPSPVGGLVLDETSHILFAAGRENKNVVYAFDLKKEELKHTIEVGNGPEDLVISTKNQLLFCANRFSNNVSVIDLKTNRETARIPVSREPVALALSPDENTLMVANSLPKQAAGDTFISSVISVIDVQSGIVVKNIDLPNGSFALKDLIFSKDGKFIYVSHLIGRYNVLTSQIEKGWINTNAITIIDTESMESYTTVLLDDIYKGAANPNGMIFSEDGNSLLVAVSGTHELFCIDTDSMHKKINRAKANSGLSQSVRLVSSASEKVKVFQDFSGIEQMDVLFDDIPKELGFLAADRKRIKLQGKGPAKLAVVNNKVLISSYFSDAIEVLDMDALSGGSYMIQIGNRDISTSEVRFGEMLFHDAENCFQQWQSCSSCHPGDARADGLNWDLLNDGIGNPKNTRSLLLAHQTPPAMTTGIRKDAETGVRAGFKYIQFFDAPEEYAKAVDAYLTSLEPVPSPYLQNGSLSKRAQLGKEIFEKLNCKACHSGIYFTNGAKYEIGKKGRYDKQNSWDTPTLIEIWRSAPYLHDGRYSDLADIFKQENHGIRDGISDEELDNLVEYLKSL